MERASAQADFVTAFVGCVVPDEARYRTAGFSRAGNRAQLNVLKSMIEAGVIISDVYSFQPIPSFPAGKRVYVRGERATLFPGRDAILLSFLNVLPFKQIHLGISVLFSLVRWSWRHLGRDRLVLLYNVSRPPAIFAYLAARLTGARIAAILFDVGVPPATTLRRFGYRVDDAFAKLIIPRLDGRIVITERISRDYAPHAHFLHVDGALAREQIPDWPVTSYSAPPTEFVLAYAGSLWEINGIRLLLDAFGKLDDSDYRLEIAGDGMLRQEVVEAAVRDKRITYHGMLTHDGVLAMYRRADALLNIRLTSRAATPYVFPSKLIEYLAMGRTVITTAVAHVQKEYGEFVFVLTKETAESLARLIQSVRSADPAVRAQKALQAREYIRRQKTWTRQGRRIAEYLAGFARGRQPAPATSS